MTEGKFEGELERLLRDPDNLSQWTKLVKRLEETGDNEEEVTKKSSDSIKLLLRSVYTNMLKRFPNLEVYWVNFAEKEFRLGNTLSSELIYVDALKVLPYSLKIWLSYLKFRLLQGNSSYSELKALFGTCELKVGSHFYAKEFWELYLQFEENYNPNPEDRSLQVFLILRKAVELPIYGYAELYSKLFKFIETHVTSSTVAVYLDVTDLQKFKLTGKSAETPVLKNDAALKDLKTRLRKIFVESYIATQYEAHKMFQYESQLKRQFYHVTYLSQEELHAWDSYLTYLEIQYVNVYKSLTANASTYNANIINKNLFHRIVLTYERCLIATAAYEKFWIRYFLFLMNCQNRQDARNVLVRSFQHVPVTSVATKLLLVEFENYNERVISSKDLSSELLAKFPGSFEVWLRFLHQEALFDNNGEDYIATLVSEKLASDTAEGQKQIFQRFFPLILTLQCVTLERKLEIFKTNHSEYRGYAKYWLSLLKLLVFNRDKIYTGTEKGSGTDWDNFTSIGKAGSPHVGFSELSKVYDQARNDLDVLQVSRVTEFYEKMIVPLQTGMDQVEDSYKMQFGYVDTKLYW